MLPTAGTLAVHTCAFATHRSGVAAGATGTSCRAMNSWQPQQLDCVDGGPEERVWNGWRCLCCVGIGRGIMRSLSLSCMCRAYSAIRMLPRYVSHPPGGSSCNKCKSSRAGAPRSSARIGASLTGELSSRERAMRWLLLYVECKAKCTGWHSTSGCTIRPGQN